MASKWMHNFSPHLSCVVTLPENALTTAVFVWVDGCAKITGWCDELTTNKFQYSLHLPDWTWGHQRDHILRSTHCLWSAAPWMPVNWTSFWSQEL